MRNWGFGHVGCFEGVICGIRGVGSNQWSIQFRAINKQDKLEFGKGRLLRRKRSRRRGRKERSLWERIAINIKARSDSSLAPGRQVRLCDWANLHQELHIWVFHIYQVQPQRWKTASYQLTVNSLWQLASAHMLQDATHLNWLWLLPTQDRGTFLSLSLLEKLDWLRAHCGHWCLSEVFPGPRGKDEPKLWTVIKWCVLLCELRARAEVYGEIQGREDESERDSEDFLDDADGCV